MQIQMSDFYARLGTIALIMGLGFFLGKRKIIDTRGNKMLVNLLLSVFMPASLFAAFPAEYNQQTSYLFVFSLIILSRIIFNKYFYPGELRF